MNKVHVMAETELLFILFLFIKTKEKVNGAEKVFQRWK